MAKKLRHIANGGAIVVGDKTAERLVATLNWGPYFDDEESGVQPSDVAADAPNDEPEGDDTPEPVQDALALPEAPEEAKAARPDVATVRAWAKEHGVPVSDKGRVAETVYEKYAEAHKN